jgi:hypothetical protein
MKIDERRKQVSCLKIDESEWSGQLFEDKDKIKWRRRMFEGMRGKSSDHDESKWRDQVSEYIR